MNKNLQEVINNPNWRLCNIEPKAGSFEFINLERSVYTKPNFADQDYMENPKKLDILALSFKDITDANHELKDLNSNFIFHSAFCGSTLLARSLDQEKKCLSIREPHVLFQLSAMKRANMEYALTSPDWGAMMKSILWFLSRNYHSSEKIIIKPSNAMNNLIPDLFNAIPNAKAIFLHSSLKQFLISNLKKGPGFAKFCNSSLGMLTTTNVPLHIQDELPNIQYNSLSDLQKAAMLWLFQLSQFNFFMNTMPEDQVQSLTITDLIEQPSMTLNKCNDFFDLDISNVDIQNIVEKGAFTKHSKDKNSKEYDKNIKKKEDVKIVSEFKSEIETTISWATEKFGATVIKTPLIT